MNCEGLACDVVEISWDDPSSLYRVKNRSNRPVVVSLTSSCGKLSVRLEPMTDALVYVDQFDLPYQASFCD
jgi:hypothetical protein